jgi:drug/metabolite transporter (DMT)-like permease
MNPHWKAVLQALFVVFLWGTSWIFVKIGLHAIPPVTFAGLRYFLAFLALLGAALATRSRSEFCELGKAEWLRFSVLGVLLYAGTQGAVFVALAYLPAVTVNLLWSFSSVLITVLGVLLLSERPGLLQWAGVLLAVIGAMIFFYPVAIPQNQSIGFSVAIVGILANAAASILGRDINRTSKYRPLIVTVISMGVGSVVLLAAGLAFEATPALDFQGWLIILWLALVNTAFAFTLWNHTLRTLTAMESSIINSTMLIWVTIFAVMFLHESITFKELVGLIGAGLGTLIVQLRPTNLAEHSQ